MKTKLLPCLVAATLLATSSAFGQATEGRPPRGMPSLRSPEVHADGRVTFRLKAARADDVQLVSGPIARQLGRTDGQKIPLQKGGDGLWSLTLGPLPPDHYPYVFELDGVRILDPANMEIIPGFMWPQNFFLVSGAEADYFAQRDVPHGAVQVLPYRSTSLGVDREVCVYTPPGYERGNARYPVLYLLHGAGGYDRSWMDMGRANLILDNLLAAGKAVPMIVVMPAGHVPPDSKAVPDGTPGGQFGADLVNDVLPLVEARFRVKPGREHRALAGLSMGAGHTYAIGLARLDLFSHLAMMSGGIGGTGGGGAGKSFAESWPDLAKDPAALNAKLKLFWFGRGEMENPERVRTFSQELTALGVRHVAHVSKYDHSFRTWRRDLYFEVAPRLFQP
jgi:enterochelin esterase family protein